MDWRTLCRWLRDSEWQDRRISYFRGTLAGPRVGRHQRLRNSEAAGANMAEALRCSASGTIWGVSGRMKLQILLGLCLAFASYVTSPQDDSPLRLHERGYLSRPGLDVLVFSDIYPDGHQTGVTIIQHGTRVAANGDVRLEKSPGQWSPMPKGGERTVDKDSATISQYLSYPDPEKNRRGF